MKTTLASMKTTLGVMCVLFLTVVHTQGPGRRMLCNADFPTYVDCLTKKGLPEHNKTYWECREMAKPSVTDEVFFKKVCRDDDVRHQFRDCIHQRKLNGTIPPVPTVCKKILGQRNLGKGVRRYLCANKERYKCMKVKAPAEDLIMMDNCQKKAFPGVAPEQFLSTVCNNNDPGVVDSAEKFGLCMIKNTVTDNQGMYPPTYIKECRNAGDKKVNFKDDKFELQGKNVREFICGNNIRYECVKNKASSNELSILKQCQDRTFSDVSIENFFSFMCSSTNESVVLQIGQWAFCVAENSQVSRTEKGPPDYLMECTNPGQSVTPQAVKEFFCEQPTRYQCVQRAVSEGTLIKMAECSNLKEEEILLKLCSSETSEYEWVNKWIECITIATQDIDLKMFCQ